MSGSNCRFADGGRGRGLLAATMAVVPAIAATAGRAGASAAPPATSQPGEPHPTPGVLAAMERITGRGIIEHARVLSDQRFRGRRASTPGARAAARYVADAFARAGLRPAGGAGGYYQVFKIRPGATVTSQLSVAIAGVSAGEFQRGRDYEIIHLPGDAADVSAPCVLVGHGITAPDLRFDEYADLDARGKVAVAFSGTPWSPETARWLGPRAAAARWGTLAAKADNAARHGAACLIVVDNPAGWRKEVRAAERLARPDRQAVPAATVPVLQFTREALTRMTDMSATELRLLATDIARDREPASMALRGRRLRLQARIAGQAGLGRNVLGVLPGRDERLRTEAVILGAHYDHLGEGMLEDVFFGANDNAAGVGALLAIARALAALPRPPRRTLVFAAFDAEEIGRRGSKHYVQRPVMPIDRTSLMINFDMIGRNDPNGIYAVGTRSSDALHALHRRLNRHVGIQLTHPNSFRLGRSDHSPFYFASVPVMYLFGGLHADYNTPEDTWEKLLPDKVEKVARLAMLTAWAAAERDRPLSFRPAADEGPFVPATGRTNP